MPELPEVETTRRGIAPHLEGRWVEEVVVRQPRLRRPVPSALADWLHGQTLERVDRRAKYLLLHFPSGSLVIHLGMSGSLRVVEPGTPAGPHDHVDVEFNGGRVLRLRDPRRFGMVDWQASGEIHPWLRHLGPEPLGPDFHGDWLARQAEGRRLAVKSLLMDNRVVVGVGNIYANEALWHARIHPARPAGRIAQARLAHLAEVVRKVIAAAIEQGGTTLRDFTRADGSPGYFAQALQVYGRAGEPCTLCATPIARRTLGQRASYYCPTCQR